MKALAALLLLLPGTAFPGDDAGTFDKDIRPLLAAHCFKCHAGPKAKSGVDLESFRDEASVLRSRKVWQKAWRSLHAREMPPEERPQPTAAERDRLTDWIEGMLRRPDPAGRLDPGRVLLRRLTRAEYSNSVSDLIPSVAPRTHRYFDPAKAFPATGLHLLHYLDGGIRPCVSDLPPDEADHGFDNQGDVLTLPPLLMEKYFQAAVEVLDQAQKDPRVYITRPGPGKTKREAAREIVAAFARRAFRRPVTDAEVEKLLELFELADRRGDPFESAVKAPLQAVLVSPHFLLKVERGEGPDLTPGVRALGPYEQAARLSYFLWSTTPDDELLRLAGEAKLRDPAVWEAQTRRMLRSPRAKALSDNFALQWLQLSAFETLMPDPALFPVYFGPGCQDLRKWMRIETQLFFETILIEDRSILEFVDADWTIANGNLAEFYGLAHFPGRTPLAGKEVAGENYWWRRYSLPDGRRGGVLTMASVLTATSYPTRTSPVKRGKWILETILGSPPPPPPPNAGTLKDDDGPAVRRSVRDRLERHRQDPNCAGCHRRMDPLGLALESYDAIGRWRESETPRPPADGPEWWDFDVDGNFQGWSFGFYGGDLHVKDGHLNIPISGGDVRLFGPPMAKTAAMDTLKIRLRNSSPAAQLRLHFLAPSETKWDMFGVPQGWMGNKSLSTAIVPQSDFQIYSFDLSKVPTWKGEIAGLMLSTEKAVTADKPKGELQVDWIWIGNGEPGPRPAPIDASGALPNGRKVSGPAELKRLLVTEYKDAFVRAFVGHLLTYALGRPLEPGDTPVVQDIARAVARDGYKFSRAAIEVARCYPFLHRRSKEVKDDE